MGMKSDIADNGSYQKFKRTGTDYLEIAPRFPYGYAIGGNNGATVQTADKLNFETELFSVQASAKLSQATFRIAGVFSPVGVGMNCGGNNGTTQVATCTTTNYVTEVTAAAPTSMTLARDNSAGVSDATNADATKGYVLGGRNSAGNAVTNCDKIDLRTQLASAAGAMPVALLQNSGLVHSERRGFSLVGWNGSSAVTSCYSMEFSTDTMLTRSTGANPWAATWCSAASNLVEKGYNITGGPAGSYLATASKLDFATITNAAVTSANSGTARFAGAAIGMSEYMYLFGGYNGSQLSLCEKVNFTTDTLSSMSTTLSQARNAMSAHGWY